MGRAMKSKRLKTLLATAANLESFIDKYRWPLFCDSFKKHRVVPAKEGSRWNRACVKHAECLKTISSIQARRVKI